MAPSGDGFCFQCFLFFLYGFRDIVQVDVKCVAYAKEHIGRDVLVLAELGEGGRADSCVLRRSVRFMSLSISSFHSFL